MSNNNNPGQNQLTPEQQAAQAAQEQQNIQASQKINQNISNDQADQDYKKNLSTLRRLVAQASPIIENKQATRKVKGPDGTVVDGQVTEKVTTGYNYYAVDGKPIEDWVQQTFGGKVTLDKDNREIKINDDGNQTQKTQQQVTTQQTTASTEPNPPQNPQQNPEIVTAQGTTPKETTKTTTTSTEEQPPI